jgi:MarR family transcriptional regulator, organic hydroperoxide resistance regulator
MAIDSHVLERAQQTRHGEGEPDDLERDVLELAHQIMMMGWLERRRLAQELAGHSLTVPQFFTLVTIHQCEKGCTMGLLADETHQCSATMTGIVDRLLKMKLVERTRDENDRRLVLVKLTESGHAILQKARDERLERLRTVMRQLDSGRRLHAIQAFKMYVSLTKEELRAEEAVSSATC